MSSVKSDKIKTLLANDDLSVSVLCIADDSLLNASLYLSVRIEDANGQWIAEQFLFSYMYTIGIYSIKGEKTSSSNTIWQLASQMMTIPMLILRCAPLLFVDRGIARTGTSWTILMFAIIRQCLIAVGWNRVRCVCVARLNHHWRTSVFIMNKGTLLA